MVGRLFLRPFRGMRRTSLRPHRHNPPVISSCRRPSFCLTMETVLVGKLTDNKVVLNKSNTNTFYFANK